MSARPGDRERKLWIAVAVAIAALLATLYPLQFFLDFLRARNLLRLAIVTLFALVAGLAVGWMLKRRAGMRELAKRHAMKDRRTSSIIAAAIQSASLTPHEMGQILGAIAGVISWVSRHEPELESVAADLSDAYEAFLRAEDQREDRLYMENKRRGKA